MSPTTSREAPPYSTPVEDALPGAADHSAKLSKMAAGYDGKIPRTFLVLIDLVTITMAFLATDVAAPVVQSLLLPPGPLAFALPNWMPLPEEANAAGFPSLIDVGWVLLVTIPITLLFMELLGGYRQLAFQSRVRVMITAALSPLVALSFLTLSLFALKVSTSSRVFIFTFGIMSVLGLGTYRALLRWYKRKRMANGAYAKNVLLVGEAPAIRWMADYFRDNVPPVRYQLAGWLNARDRGVATQVPLPMLGSVEDLGVLLVHHPIHEIIAVQSATDRDWIREVVEHCDYFRVLLRIVPETLLFSNLRDLRLVFRSEPLRLPEVVLSPPHLESDALFLKRVIDIVVSASLLVALTPLFVLVAVAIKLTTPKLPVLYPWRVIGLKGRPFTGYKFTTMVADADAQKKNLMDRNEMIGPVFKIKDDPRITPLGRFLRKFSINELPQLWSVLKGDMSLVGPRPAGPHELERYQMWHKRKLCVQPGITCLWQVSGRNRVSNFDDWVKLDLKYIDEWSLWLDFRILIRTAWAVLSGTGS